VRFRVQLDARSEPGIDRDRWDEIVEAIQPHRRLRSDANRGVRFGVTLADGRRTATGGGWQMELTADENPSGPIMRVQGRGGGGSEREYTMGFLVWLWPLPPIGPLTPHFQWTALGITESSIELDGTTIHDASRTVTKVWT